MNLRHNVIALTGLALATMACALSGCASTKAAYDSAENLRETAFVLTEHYAALIHEAADLKEAASTPQEVKDALKAAGNASAKFVIGDPAAQPPVPSLLDLVNNYEALGDAKSKEALTKAIADATHALNGLIKAVQRARLARTSDTEQPVETPAAMLAAY